MNTKHILLTSALAAAVAMSALVAARGQHAAHPMATTSAPRLVAAAETLPLGGATEWINSPPLQLSELRGKVVLVNFWTFTCINWLRQLPYVRAWAEKYQKQGLVVIGVHSPEFEFEKNLDDIRHSARQLRVEYPIAVDNDHAIWRAFHNRAWPALYLIDAQGRLRHHHFGEGAYEEAERAIQQLLAEAGSGRGEQGLVAVDPAGSEAAADWDNLKSPENYLGYERTENFAFRRAIRKDVPALYDGMASLPLNGWSVTGTWTMGPEFATLNEPAGSIAYRFHARDAHLVMAPSVAGRAIRFRVTLDGAPPGVHRGADVDAEGWGTLQEGRLYQLVRQSGEIVDRRLEIEFLEPGVRAYAFTFG
jgi:thiol-disulfide isomerase/thioredoxin